MTGVQGKWIWYELMTGDAAGAKAFYEAVVGWEITLDAVPTGNPEMSYALIGNADGGKTGGVLTITAEMAEHGARPAWLGYIGVEDCAATLAQVEARGGKTWMPLTQLDVGTVALASDPWGAPFYIMTPTPPPGGGTSTAYSPCLVGRCGWNELYTKDQGEAERFYTELFGWSLAGSMDMGDYGTYQFVGYGDATGEDAAMGAIMTCPPQAPFPHWNHYFRVESVAAAKAAVEAQGGTVPHGPMEVPGGDWVLSGIDPQGALFNLVGKKGD